MFKALIDAIRLLAALLFLAGAITSGVIAYTDPESRIASGIVAVSFALLAIASKPNARKKCARSKALYSSLDELADAAENREAKLDATIKAVLRDIRDDLESLSDECDDMVVSDSLQDIVYNLTRTIGDEPKSEAQALAHNRRVDARAEIIRHLKSRR